MINSRDINELHPFLQQKAKQLLDLCKEKGLNVILTSTYRDIESQQKIYDDGIKTGHIVTKVKGGGSYHNYRLAFDICIIKNGKVDFADTANYKKIGSIGKVLGLEWGGDFVGFADMLHFQYRFSKTLNRKLTINDLKNGLKI